MLKARCHRGRDQMLNVAQKTATPPQRKALEAVGALGRASPGKQ